MSLIEVSRRLRNETINRAVAPFTEVRASVRRAILMVISLIWVVHWSRIPSNVVLSGEARALLPWIIAFVVGSIAWAVVVRRPTLRNEEWPDAVGTAADFLGITVLMSVAFNLMLPFVIFLPLTCITMGARYSKTAFWLGIVGAVMVVGFSAPEGYWMSRPVVAVLAIALLVGIPMTVNRILTSLREISEQAIQARDTQTRFLAMMSHELRTPLNSIVNASGLIDVSRLPEDQRTLVDHVKTNAAVLLSRVDDVLDVAAIDGGTFQLNSAPFDLHGALHTVRSVVGSLVQEKGVSLSVSVAEDVPQVLIGDARRITQVLCNLTSNAVKYTPRSGHVEICARRSGGTAPDVCALEVSVADTGIGIPDDQKEKIFEAFHQISQGDARAHDGVGLGLHIVKTVSDRMKGRLEVSNRPEGSGSVFTWRLTLPVAGPGLRGTETMEMLELLKRHRIAAAPRSCLVIDDNVSSLDIMRRVLVLGGHRVLTASSGDEGLRILRSTPIDVAFLDLHMPGMSGWDVLQEHRNGRGGSQATKIVILSAVTDAESQERAFAMGAAGYLRKPMMTAEVLDTLVRLGPSGAGAPMLAPHLKELRNNHLDVMRSIASQEDVSAYLEACVEELSGTMADIESAAASRNERSLFEQVHRLKNVFMNGDFAEGAAACARVMESLKTHQIPEADIAVLARITEETIRQLKREPEFGQSTAGAVA